MLFATFLVAAIATLVAREIYLELWLGGAPCIRRARTGWLAVEVRRRVAMERVPQHVSEFPVPREQRILVSRLLGMVLWHREMSVALPNAACEHLDQITPQEFDRQFPNWLRLVSTPN